MIKKISIAMALSVGLALSANAGNPTNAGLVDPVVTPPSATFSWTGPYAGVSYGKSQHTRTYEREMVRHWDEDILHRDVEEWEEHYYRCVGKEGHFGRKCKVGGFEDAKEIQSLDLVNNPWRNSPQSTVRYDAGYGPAVWLGGQSTLDFTLPDQRDLPLASGKWAQLEYLGYEQFENVTEWTETIQHSETYTEQYEVTHNDTTIGGFVGYRMALWDTPVIGGVEANYFRAQDLGDEFAQVEAQVGVSLGRVLPYVAAGTNGLKVVGTDIALGRKGRLLVGLRHWEQNADRGTQLRVGWKF